MTPTRRATLSGLAAVLCGAAHKASAAPDGALFVLATLYSRHAATPAYDVAALRRVIERIDPDVLVLDVTPQELARRQVHESKIEYVGAVFPYLAAVNRPVYPAEPDEPLFTQITEPLGRAFADLPALTSEALDRYESGLFALLGGIWTSAEAVNDALTDQLMAAKARLTSEMIPAFAHGQAQWDAHTTARTLDALAAHPSARVLLLTGVENTWRIRPALAGAGVPLVDMAEWLSRQSL